MKKQAFTLIETLVAIAILAVSITILSGLQVRSFIKTLKGHQDVERVFLIKSQFYKNFLDLPKKRKTVVEEFEDLNLKVTSQLLDIEKKSSLFDFEKELVIVQSIGDWTSDLGSRNINFFGLATKPEEDKK